MPWTPQQMAAKGAKNSAKAAEMANAILRTCRAKGGGKECERIAIATALARTNPKSKR